MKYLKNQQGLIGIVAMLVLLVATVGAASYFAYQARQAHQPVASSSKDAKTVPQESTKTRDVAEDLLTLTLPAGWTKVSESKYKDLPSCGSQTYHYADDNGNFFDICVDPPGRGVDADASWILAKSGKGFKITSENPQCAKSVGDEAMFCAAGDDMFLLGMAPMEAGSSATISGHTYYFFAGNIKKETGVDLEPYRRIVTSIQVK